MTSPTPTQRPTPQPNLRLYFLQSSRSIRIAFLLEELKLPYTSIFFPRINQKVPADFKERSGSVLGKAPVLRDGGEGDKGGLVVIESGGITEYILESYAPRSSLFGGNDFSQREQIRSWIHAAEGTFMVHALAILYARCFLPENVPGRDEILRGMEVGLGRNVVGDLDWLERELSNGHNFLVGDKVTAADTMMLFSIQFIFKRELCPGREIGEWKNVEAWVERCEGLESWGRAVQKTGHRL